MSSTVRVRFAPSPTGALHIGGVRTALYNYLFAKKHGGEFLLRIEDTDQTRFVPGAEEYIIETLDWLGIRPDHGPHVGGPDAPYRQSERKPMYKQYADLLIEKGWAYYAFDTADELEVMREKMKAAGVKSPQYNAVTREYMRNSLTLPAAETRRLLDENAPYAIRIKIPRKQEVRFYDEIRGWVAVAGAEMDDKVLLKSDGMPTYHLANVVDDRLMRITHVIRGEEWLPSAPLHHVLYQAFAWEAPKMAHLPLLLSPDGDGKLSKRDGDKYGFPVFPLEWNDPATGAKFSGYRETGYLPEAVVNTLALLGWNPGDNREIFSLQELVELFSLERVGKSGVKFDKKKSVWFNQHYLKLSPNERFLPELKSRLAAENLDVPSDEKLKKIVGMLKDRVEYTKDFFVHGEYFFRSPREFDREAAAKKWNGAFVAGLLPALEGLADWTAPAIEAAVKAEVDKAGLAAGKIMPALRLGLCGVGFGPGIYDVMETLGKETTVQRLQFALKTL